MTLILLVPSLISLILQPGVNALHPQKPMIYINLFDEILTDNTSSKLNKNEGISSTNPTTGQPSETISMVINLSDHHVKDEIKAHASSSVHHENHAHGSVHDETKPPSSVHHETHAHSSIHHKTHSPRPVHDDMHNDGSGKIDNAESAIIKDSKSNLLSTNKDIDLIDPEFFTPQIGKIFFLRAITNLIQHIMEAIFTIDETTRLNEAPSFDFDSVPSRNPKKRDLSSMEELPALNNETETIGLITDPVSLTSHATDSVNSTGIYLLDDIKKKDTNHSTTHSKETKDNKSNISTSLNVTKSKLILLTDKNKMKNESEQVVTTTTNQSKSSGQIQDKHLVAKTQPKKDYKPSTIKEQSTVDYEYITSFGIPDENLPELNDEVIYKQDTHYDGEFHAPESHERNNTLSREVILYDAEDYEDSAPGSSTSLFIGMTITVFIVIITGSAIIAFIFRRQQSTILQSRTQTSANPHTSVA